MLIGKLVVIKTQLTHLGGGVLQQNDEKILSWLGQPTSFVSC